MRYFSMGVVLSSLIIQIFLPNFPSSPIPIAWAAEKNSGQSPFYNSTSRATTVSHLQTNNDWAIGQNDTIRYNNGPHNGYNSSAGNCATCHRSHTGQSEATLITPDITSLCLSCHGTAAQGAGSDVENGIWDNSNPWTSNEGSIGGRLNGGGFVTIKGVQVTSSHNVKGIGGSSGVGIAWGYVENSPGVSGTLECTSCHNPHGSSNYRILRDANNGRPYNDPEAHKWVPNDPNLGIWENNLVLTDPGDVSQGGTTKNYTYVADSLASPSADNKIQAAYSEGMSLFCNTCHTGYATSTRSHPSYLQENYDETLQQPLVFALSSSVVDNSQTRITCLTCHIAHGTTATMSGYANTNSSGVPDSGMGGIAPEGNSALLFYNNRGVCVSCHKM